MENITLSLLIIVALASTLELIIILKAVKKSQLRSVFICDLACILICILGQMAQILFSDKLKIPPIYFEYIVYIGTCLLPVFAFFTGLIFAL